MCVRIYQKEHSILKYLLLLLFPYILCDQANIMYVCMRFHAVSILNPVAVAQTYIFWHHYIDK